MLIIVETCFVEVHYDILLLDIFKNFHNDKFKYILPMIRYEQIRTKGRVFDQMNFQCFRVGNSPFLMILLAGRHKIESCQSLCKNQVEEGTIIIIKNTLASANRRADGWGIRQLQPSLLRFAASDSDKFIQEPSRHCPHISGFALQSLDFPRSN